MASLKKYFFFIDEEPGACFGNSETKGILLS